MEFYRLRAVIKPRIRTYSKHCDGCSRSLYKLPHVYAVGRYDYTFFTYRYCLKCAEKLCLDKPRDLEVYGKVRAALESERMKKCE